MSTQRQLFTLLFTPPPHTTNVAEQLTQADGWEDAIHLAEAWRVLPRLARVLHSHRLCPSSSAKALLSRLQIQSALRSGYVARRGGQVLRSLQDAKIRVAAFKGVATIARLHRSPADRSLCDIDLLIDEALLEDALEAIRSTGFVPWIKGSTEDQHSFNHNRILQSNYSVCLIDDEGLEVDLHYRLHGRIDHLLRERLWQRLEKIPLLGKPIPVVSTIDSMLLATHHSLRSQLAPFPTVRDLGDLLDLWNTFPQNGPIKPLAAEALEYGLGTPLLALLAILQHIGSISADDTRISALRSSLGHQVNKESEKLTRWFFLRLESPWLGGRHIEDLLIILADPMAMLSLARDRLFERGRTAATPWRKKQEELREQRGLSYSWRATGLFRSLTSLNRTQLRSLWCLTRAQRRAFTPSEDDH